MYALGPPGMKGMNHDPNMLHSDVMQDEMDALLNPEALNKLQEDFSEYAESQREGHPNMYEKYCTMLHSVVGQMEMDAVLDPDDDSTRREHIRVGYVDDEGYPFDVDTDEEADKAIRHDLCAKNPNWRPVAMGKHQLYLYKQHKRHKRREKRSPSTEFGGRPKKTMKTENFIS